MGMVGYRYTSSCFSDGEYGGCIFNLSFAWHKIYQIIVRETIGISNIILHGLRMKYLGSFVITKP